MKFSSPILYLSILKAVRASCDVTNPEVCTTETSCSVAGGIWIPVAPAEYIPGTAVQGGRRYTLEQSNSEFTQTISAPNGGYCTLPVSTPSEACQNNATLCLTMGDCFYRTDTGRWYHTSSSELCVAACSDPLVFCDESRCSSTLGCSWFIKTQANSDQCYCTDNPGIFGYPPAPPDLSWAYWDQPWSLPIFILALIAAVAILYQVYVFNIRPWFHKLIKKRPRE
jgi:hypothetical protein